MYLTTKLELDDNQREYLKELNVSQGEIEFIENDEFDKVDDINRLIKILFACTKKDVAWDLIKANHTIIDFKDIFSSQYMEIDRTAIDTFLYMYENNIIDDINYMYFEVLSGKLNNWEFWENKFEGLSTTEILELLHNSYNNIFVQQDIDPYDLGLIKLTPEQFIFIFDKLKDEELVDFIFEDKPCVELEPMQIQTLLLSGNLDFNKHRRYFKILFEIYTNLYDIGDEQYTAFYFSFFDLLANYLKEHNADYTDIEVLNETIREFNIDVLQKLYKVLDWIKYKEIYSYDDYLTLAINNYLMMVYPYSILKYIEELTGYTTEEIKVSKYLNDKVNISMVLTYKFHHLFDTSDYIIKYIYPQGFRMIYSISSNKILFGYETMDYSEADFSFIDNYEIVKSIDNEIFQYFNSEEEYIEFIESCKDFKWRVKNALQ